MEKYLKFIIVVSLSLSSVCFAGIIDLGTLEVDGEVRRPKVQFYQPEMVSDKSVKYVAEKQLNNLENLILNNLIEISKSNRVRKDGK